MQKLKLNLDDLEVVAFDTTHADRSSKGTVHARSCQYQGDPDYTAYYSTCDSGSNDGCFSGPNSGCVGWASFEDTCDVCTNVESCGCAFSEYSNCHRCTGA
jgi:hypothetical protein